MHKLKSNPEACILSEKQSSYTFNVPNPGKHLVRTKGALCVKVCRGLAGRRFEAKALSAKTGN